MLRIQQKFNMNSTKIQQVLLTSNRFCLLLWGYYTDIMGNEVKRVIPDEVRGHLTKDIVNFYLHEANMQLEDVYQASGKATERGYLFMSAVVALTCGCGWLISKADESVYMSLISITAIVSAILILFIMITKVLPIHTVWTRGKMPSEFDIKSHIDYYCYYGHNDDSLYINIVADHLDAIEEEIRLNKEQIEGRMTWFRLCLWLAAISVSLMTCFLLFTFL